MDPPIKPEESDCCNSGCNPCIFDVYEEQMKKYQQGIKDDNRKNLKNCLDPLNYVIFEMVNCIQHTHDSFIYTFQYKRPVNNKRQLNQEELCISCKPGQHLLLRGQRPGHDSYFTRAYTPIPSHHNPGRLTFSVIIKLYETGAMSCFIKQLTLNSETLWRGPYGNFEISYDYKHILCIAQGTGIAPIYSIIHEMLNNDECETFFKLFFCCRTMDDVLLRDELYEFSRYWNFSYEVYLSQEQSIHARYNEVIHGNKLSKNHIINYLNNKPVNSMQVLICGNEQFNHLMHDYVRELIAEEKIYSF